MLQRQGERSAERDCRNRPALFLPPSLPRLQLPARRSVPSALHLPPGAQAAPLRAVPAALARVKRTELGDLGAAASLGLERRKAGKPSPLNKQVFVTAAP